MDPLSNSVPDWRSKIIKNQHVEPFYYDLQTNPTDQIYWHKRKFSEWKYATGIGLYAFLTKFGFTYLGGLVQARKQFIPGYLYFLNSQYNYIGGLRFIVGGYLIGTIFSTFAFGHPWALEDMIKRKFSKHTDVALFETNLPL
jgi:hypothetical protein